MAPSDDNPRRPLLVGITGGIASGKSTVSDAFAALGVPVIDTDALAREVVAPGSPGLQRVVEAFGPEVLAGDGSLDRAGMRKRVFGDDRSRKRLEEILHPLIWAAVEARIATVEAPYCLVVVPLLVEAGSAHRLDRVLVVDCPEALQLERLMRRDGETEVAARRMLASQASRTERLAAADDVLVNDGSHRAVEEQVSRLHELYRGLARQSGR